MRCLILATVTFLEVGCQVKGYLQAVRKCHSAVLHHEN